MDFFPFFAGVAGLAFGAIAAVMNIADAVTIDAGDANALPALIGMACGALNLLVGTAERKLGFGVIEGVGGAPGLDAMAAFAGLAEPALVRFNFLMASDTFRRRFRQAFALHVAAIAGGRLVRALQCKIG